MTVKIKKNDILLLKAHFLHRKRWYLSSVHLLFAVRSRSRRSVVILNVKLKRTSNSHAHECTSQLTETHRDYSTHFFVIRGILLLRATLYVYKFDDLEFLRSFWNSVGYDVKYIIIIMSLINLSIAFITRQSLF